MIQTFKVTVFRLIYFSLLWRCRYLLAVDQQTVQLVAHSNRGSVLTQQQRRRLQFSSCKNRLLRCQNNISKIMGKCSKKTQQQIRNKLGTKTICSMEWFTCRLCLIVAKQCRMRSQQPKKGTTNNPNNRLDDSPTSKPSWIPTSAPLSPTNVPLKSPTMSPQERTNKPTLSPINTPTSMPFASLTHAPLPPTSTPSTVPKHAPLSPTSKLSFSPTSTPYLSPANEPSINPTIRPSTSPTASPRCILNNGATAPCNANNIQKKGIGLGIRSNTNGSCSDRIPILNALNVHWNYGWNYDRSPCQPTSSNFIPMAWNGGRNESDLRNRIINANIPLYVSNGTTTIMFGYNEPDLTGQANMPVAVAIERWSVLQELGIPLVSPSAGNPEGLWMKEFMGNATVLNLRIDYIGVHSYAGGSFPSFVSKMTRIYNLYQKPLVLTEFASADWAATTMPQNKLNPCQVLSFMKQVLPWLEETWWIHSYAWFPFSPTSIPGWPSALFDQNNSLTVLGRYYQSVNHQNRYGDDVSCP